MTNASVNVPVFRTVTSRTPGGHPARGAATTLGVRFTEGPGVGGVVVVVVVGLVVLVVLVGVLLVVVVELGSVVVVVALGSVVVVVALGSDVVVVVGPGSVVVVVVWPGLVVVVVVVGSRRSATIAITDMVELSPGTASPPSVPDRRTGSVTSPGGVDRGTVNLTLRWGMLASMARSWASVWAQMSRDSPDGRVVVHDQPSLESSPAPLALEPAGRSVAMVSLAPLARTEPPALVAPTPNVASLPGVMATGRPVAGPTTSWS